MQVRYGVNNRAEFKLNAQYILISVLVVNNCFLNCFCSKALEETCPSMCICNGESVTCSNLKLTEIPTTTLEESVKSFDLSENMLTQLKEFAFKEYRILETLYLSENQIDSVDPRAFSGLGMLINIDLSYNNLEFIMPNVFSETPLLKTVSFKGNPRVVVPESSPILESYSITSLDLSSCDLNSVDTHTFSQLPSLHVLNLNSNKLHEFNRDILNTLTEIRVMDLGNNNWKCDCNIVEVLNWLSDRRKSRGLDGEHKPVKCFNAGVYKTIWTAARKNEFCTRQSRIFSETIASTETTTILRVQSEEEISKPGSGKNEILSWNKNSLLIFCILPLMVGFATFLALVGGHCVINFMNTRRQVRMSPARKNGTSDSKTCIFSRIPIISTSISSEFLNEKHISGSRVDTGSGHYAYDSNHLYERIE